MTEPKSMKSRPRARRPRSQPPPPPLELPATALAAGVLFGLVLLLAPPASNFAWAVNGWRSAGPDVRLALIVAAGAAALPVMLRLRGAVAFGCIAVAIALVAAFPLREAAHLLSDTQLRLRSLSAFAEGVVTSPFSEWSARLHASPLDTVVNLLVPLALVRTGLEVREAIAWTNVALAFGYFAALWQAARRMGAGEPIRLPLALALGTSGTLLAFAAFPESTALLAATTAWWWAELVAPLDRPRQVARLVAAWVALILAHRVGLLFAVPMAWRVFGPALSGDRPETRRMLGLTGALALGVTFVTSSLLGAREQIGTDLQDLWIVLRSPVLFRIAPTDVVNSLVLVAPLAVLAPLLAGGAGIAGFARRPLAGLVLAAALPLLVVVGWLLPLSSSGLGAHRDWEANIPLGISLTIAAGALIAGLSPGRQRGALLVSLPLLVLLGGGWLAVNADPAAVERRAQALATKAPMLPELQRSHVYLFLGQRAMDASRFEDGAGAFEQSFALAPSPRRALLAAEGWILADRPVAARRMIDAARARGELSPELAAAAARLETMLADSATSSPAP